MMPIRFKHAALLTAAGLVLAGCAQAMPGYEAPTKQNRHRLSMPAPSGGMMPDGTYALSNEEQKFDCRRLTGSAQVKILQLRHHARRPTTSAASRWIGGASDAMGRGTDTVLGKDPPPASSVDEYTRERAHLEALNRALAARKCPTYNLAAELRPEKGSELPTPIGKR